MRNAVRVLLSSVVVLHACASANPRPSLPADLVESETERRRVAARIRVMGTVVDGSGNPVPGAVVHVEAHPRSRCVGGRGALGDATVRPDGWFIKTLYFYSLPTTPSCLTVRVRPPNGSRLSPDSRTDIMSEFRHGASIDTVFAHFELGRSSQR